MTIYCNDLRRGAALPAAARDRLLGAIALAERPGTDGERAAAECAIGRIIVANAEAIKPLLTIPMVVTPPRYAVTRPWRDICRDCRHDSDLLSAWEYNFVCDLLRRSSPVLTERQSDVLLRIAKRIGVPVAEDADARD